MRHTVDVLPTCDVAGEGKAAMTMTGDDLDVEPDRGPRADRPRRRRFSAEYKARILAEYDAAPDGERGTILRREGLYSWHVVDWRRSAESKGRAGPRPKDRRDREIERLQVARSGLKLN